jgi:hypothetical protein
MKAGTEVPPNKLRNGLKFDNAEAPYPARMDFLSWLMLPSFYIFNLD